MAASGVVVDVEGRSYGYSWWLDWGSERKAYGATWVEGLLSLLEKAGRWKKELKLEKAGQRSTVKLAGRGDHFRFSSVFIYKNNQTKILKKTKTKPNQIPTDRFRFGFLCQKLKKPILFFNIQKPQNQTHLHHQQPPRQCWIHTSLFSSKWPST